MMRSPFAFGPLAVCVVLLALGAAPPAEAQDQPTRDAEARAIYDAGVIAYDGGHYDEALEHFQRSYALSGRAALLYNIASAAERARQDALALEQYEAYLAAVPDSPLRARVETRIAELQASQQARAEAAAAEAAAEEAAAAEQAARHVEGEPLARPEASASRGPGPLILISAGAAVAVAGGVMLGIGLADRAAVESTSAGEAHWRDDLARRYARGGPLMNVGLVALPLGLVAAGAGVVWQIKRGAQGDAAEGPLELSVGVGSLALRGSF